MSTLSVIFSGYIIGFIVGVYNRRMIRATNKLIEAVINYVNKE